MLVGLPTLTPQLIGKATFEIPTDLPIGYHRLHVTAGGVDAEDIPPRLPYLRMVLEEAMRLYPPVTRIDRVAAADDELCGHHIRKGDMVSIWPWVVHRHTRLWDRPDLFDPEHFSPEAKAGRHRFQYIPFGAGTRVCIGAQFALA